MKGYEFKLSKFTLFQDVSVLSIPGPTISGISHHFAKIKYSFKIWFYMKQQKHGSLVCT